MVDDRLQFESLLADVSARFVNLPAGQVDAAIEPFGLGLVLILVAATLAPMVPLVFLAFPMDTLLELLARLIFGL
jgi:hypothetical protein